MAKTHLAHLGCLTTKNVLIISLFPVNEAKSSKQLSLTIRKSFSLDFGNPDGQQIELHHSVKSVSIVDNSRCAVSNDF